VRQTERPYLQREVRDHEPQVALFSPADELSIYQKLVAGAEEMLNPGGYLVLEIGLGMEEKVLGLLDSRWKKLPTKTDLQGIPRTIVALRAPR
ncbi:MAG TPA: peptide chain release factor N(5)-glutamine methyltransferase, partial [Terriglobia bacterium]|nr:peptide chain release factor N(5)-glutamine methyltransferase [Terriglobia bacterium]